MEFKYMKFKLMEPWQCKTNNALKNRLLRAIVLWLTYLSASFVTSVGRVKSDIEKAMVPFSLNANLLNSTFFRISFFKTKWCSFPWTKKELAKSRNVSRVPKLFIVMRPIKQIWTAFGLACKIFSDKRTCAQISTEVALNNSARTHFHLLWICRMTNFCWRLYCMWTEMRAWRWTFK